MLNTESIDTLKKLLLLSLGSLVAMTLPGCSALPERPEAALQQPQPTQLETIADKNFSADTFYSLLVAEMALDRNRVDIAKSNYIQQAGVTGDLAVIARAARIASVIKDYDSALTLSHQWIGIDSSDNEAKLIFISSLINTEQYIQAFDESLMFAQSSESTVFYDIAVKSAEEKSPLISELGPKYEAAIKRFPSNEELLTGYSILLQAKGEFQKAMLMVDKSIQINPNEIRHSYQKSRILQATGQNQSAVEIFAAMVERFPDNKRLRLRYANILIRQDVPQAQKQFQILHENQPDDPDLLLTLALVQQENKELEGAKLSFKKLILMNQRVDEAYFGLGQLALENKKIQQAIESFEQVKDTNLRFRSVNSIAHAIDKEEGLSAARAFFASKRADFDEDGRDQLTIAEAAMVYQKDGFSETLKIYNESLQESPNNTTLLYSRALLFSENSDIEKAERDFLKIIEIKPDSATALNAWGYTLADKTLRYSEARDYIRRAYELQPNEAAILDSMGWVEYKLGNLTSALSFLERAMTALPDDEIAAHLGEVLWQSGQTEKAKTIWQQGLEINDESLHIINIMKKLKASEPEPSEQ